MKKWFVICTKRRQEIKVSQHLNKIGVTNYCPTTTFLKNYSDRKKKIKQPILPSYVLVNLDEKYRDLVFSVPGVLRYLFLLGRPAIVSSREIKLMQDNLKGIYDAIELKTQSVGSFFKVPDGPFAGIDGTLIESNKTRVKIQLESLGVNIVLKKSS
tara:strand:- start:382 stop:849 length:468 start_codon:yes stop_codon:yes gene_type:complete